MDNLNLTVSAGDIFGFIGQNGAGKTTTLRAVVGIMDFDEGEITIDGHSVRTEPLACKKITAYVPDNPELYGYLTGIRYLNFLADIYKLDSNFRTERIGKYAGDFGLIDNLGDPISSYSHGMKQKLSLIGAFMHQPKLLVLDEPFVGLDPSAVHEVKRMMFELCQQGGAVFFSTHVLEVAEKLCNKVAIIRGGKLQATGTMEEVRGNNSLENVFLELVENA